jgi:hypothetical protein
MGKIVFTVYSLLKHALGQFKIYVICFDNILNKR